MKNLHLHNISKCVVKCLLRATEGERKGYIEREDERTRKLEKIKRHRERVREG